MELMLQGHFAVRGSTAVLRNVLRNTGFCIIIVLLALYRPTQREKDICDDKLKLIRLINNIDFDTLNLQMKVNRVI